MIMICSLEVNMWTIVDRCVGLVSYVRLELFGNSIVFVHDRLCLPMYQFTVECVGRIPALTFHMFSGVSLAHLKFLSHCVASNEQHLHPS